MTGCSESGRGIFKKNHEEDQLRDTAKRETRYNGGEN